MSNTRGMTAVGMLLTMVVVIYIGITIMRAVPVYIEHYSVTQALSKLDKIPQDKFSAIPQANMIMLHKKIKNQLYVDGLYMEDENITVTHNDKIYTVNVKYEIIKPLFFNVSLLFKFDDSHKVNTRAN